MTAEHGIDLELFMSANLYNEHAQLVPMPSLWAQQPAVMIFLRHFGCIACRAHATQIWQQRTLFEQKGAKIYFIGNGSPRLIAKFKEDLGLRAATILTDPNLRSFEAAGFKRGLMHALGPKSARNVVGLLRDGYRQGRPSRDNGNYLQLGGVVMMSTSGKVKYHFVSEATGDFPEIDEIGMTSANKLTPDYSMR